MLLSNTPFILPRIHIPHSKENKNNKKSLKQNLIYVNILCHFYIPGVNIFMFRDNWKSQNDNKSQKIYNGARWNIWK